MQRGIATLVAVSLLAWSVSFHMYGFTKNVEAANLTSVSDTITDSHPTSTANHTIVFTTPNGLAVSETITLTFDDIGDAFDLTGIIEDDIDIDINGAASTTVAGAATAGDWGVTINTGTDVITLTAPSAQGGVASSSQIEIRIGTNAVDSGTGVNQITNPGATSSYQIDIGGTMQDSGTAMVAIIENVLVTANVEATLVFTVSGTTTGATINGSPTTTFGASTNVTLPFGTLSAGTSKVLGQDLTVTTNAANGYVVTVEQDSNIISATLADIDGFVDGSYTDTPQAWARPTGNIGNENTWGHWALTTNDNNLQGAGTDFTADQWVAASTTPRAIMAHNDPADGTTLGIGRATVGYQIEITSLQEAGDDYSTTLTYIATPTF